MDIKAINLTRARMYHFLSTMYRDELPLHLIEQMQGREFLDRIDALQEVCAIQVFYSGLTKMTSGLQSGTAQDVFSELRYEYADLFLNAGNNPAFPYESCYITREPLVMQEPVVAIRAALNRAGMRKTPDYSGGDQPPQVWRQLPKVSSIAASPS